MKNKSYCVMIYVTQQVTMTTGLKCTEKSSICTFGTNLWKEIQRDNFAGVPGSFCVESNVLVTEQGTSPMNAMLRSCDVSLQYDIQLMLSLLIHACVLSETNLV